METRTGDRVKSALFLVVIILLAGCGGCRSQSERAMYKLACEAVRTDPHLPRNAVLHPMKTAKFYIGKNAACVQLTYEFINESGGRRTAGSYTVWLKNMAHSWQVDRCFPTPVPVDGNR